MVMFFGLLFNPVGVNVAVILGRFVTRSTSLQVSFPQHILPSKMLHCALAQLTLEGSVWLVWRRYSNFAMHLFGCFG